MPVAQTKKKICGVVTTIGFLVQFEPPTSGGGLKSELNWRTAICLDLKFITFPKIPEKLTPGQLR